MNKMISTASAVLLSSTLTAGVAYAGDNEWTGKASLGYLAASGNTDSRTLNALLEGAYKTGNWKFAAGAGAYNGAESGDTNAERYTANLRADYDLTTRDYLFGQINFEADRFGGYSRRFSETVGYGRKIIAADAHKLNGEIGLGARQTRLTNDTDENEGIAFGALKYDWVVSKTTNFHQHVTVEAGNENTYWVSDTGLKVGVSSNLFLTLGYVIKHNTEVPVGTEKTDRYTAVALEYSF